MSTETKPADWIAHSVSELIPDGAASVFYQGAWRNKAEVFASIIHKHAPSVEVSAPSEREREALNTLQAIVMRMDSENENAHSCDTSMNICTLCGAETPLPYHTCSGAGYIAVAALLYQIEQLREKPFTPEERLQVRLLEALQHVQGCAQCNQADWRECDQGGKEAWQTKKDAEKILNM